MPGKEGSPMGVDELAVREVEGYIDRLEKQSETSSQNNQTKPQATNQIPVSVATDQNAIPRLPIEGKQNVILPLEKYEIEHGTKKKPTTGLKWLSEWCVYMIKKYPGRIFYSPPKQNA